TTATASSSVATVPYAITVDLRGMSATNYDLQAVSGRLTILPAQLTVQADPASRLYGQVNPPMTYTITGFVNGDTIDSAGVFGSPFLFPPATPNSPVADSPYPILVDVSRLSALNYNFTGVNSLLTVTKAQLTVTPDNATRVYGQDNPAFIYTIT